MSMASQHFSLKELADGVYAAIASDSGGAFSNAGIIDLGDSTLVFDTMNTPVAASDLKCAAKELTGRSVYYVVNSHWHADHWMGNQVFDQRAMIISTPETLELMRSELDDILESQRDYSGFQKEIEDYEKIFQVESDPLRKEVLRSTISRWRFELEALPGLEPRLPNMTFEKMITLHGKRRQAELYNAGKGHTVSDVFLVLSEEQIVFWGDLGFFSCQPYMASCDLEGWKSQILSMTQSLYKHFIPGHGPLGNQMDLRLEHEYIVTLEEKVRRAFQDGVSVEAALSQISLPDPFNDWIYNGAHRFEANVRFLYEYFKEEQE
ncbi:MAG: MBL fold metallo-hydrolase [Anaerolineales bacterium]|nr:MBL fold metallo-hydrolase [Anaerolineales bacterium]